jgi:hypothetical protein
MRLAARNALCSDQDRTWRVTRRRVPGALEVTRTVHVLPLRIPGRTRTLTLPFGFGTRRPELFGVVAAPARGLSARDRHPGTVPP